MPQSYNYLLCNLPMKREVLYPVKSRNELKKVYNDIVNLSKNSPFFMFDFSKENQEYALGIKEYALELRAKIYEMQETDASGFNDKAVKVSNEDILSANLLNQETDGLPDILQIKVNSLAKVQVNRGKEYMSSSIAFPPGEYKFNAHVMDECYPLTFVHKHRMSHEDTMKRIADFINQFVPGINAEVELKEEEETENTCCLIIASDLSGRFGDKKFSFEDESYKEGIVDYFGLDQIERTSSCSSFTLNGEVKETATNDFTLENTLHITLNNSDNSSVDVKIVPDSNKILKSTNSVLSTYNNIIELAKSRLQVDKDHYSAAKLISEMISLVKSYSEELKACGIMVKDDGTLYLDDSVAVAAAENREMELLFKRKNGFITMLIDKSESIAINPIDYMEKKIVFYPNSGKCTFCNPYITSMYSGMLFSSYC